MSKKADLAEGQEVMVDGNAGFTVVKLMNLSAKVEDEDGKSKIVPYSQITTGKGSKKPASKKEEEEKPAPKKTSKKKPAKKSYTKPDEDAENEDPDDSAAEITSSAPVKQYKRKVGDDIGTLLDKAGTPTKMIDAVKKHKAYKHINQEAFKRTAVQKNDLQSGLFKMRLANLLRAAVRRMEK